MDDATRSVMEAEFGTLADLIRETNTELLATRIGLGAEIAATRTELSTRIDHLGARIDHLGGRVDHLTGRVDRLGSQVAETNGRLDNLIVIAGDHTRSLRAHVADLEARVEALEQKAS
jgi:outer membrane murein-binding lipoprotein Lpp